MPTPTYTPLANVTLGTAVSSVTFSSIPATYRDLILVINGSVVTATSFNFRFNGDTGTNYSVVNVQGFSPPTSGTSTDNKMNPWLPNNLVANQPFVLTSNFMDYSATDKHKPSLHRIGGQAGGETWVAMTAGRWADTAAITTILISSGANFNIGATFSLYGIRS
jgi:hypothetical protein